MKRKLFAVGIATFATVAIAGSGFAAWFFNDETIEAANGVIKIEITEGAKNAGTLTTTFDGKDYKVVLDQGGFDKKADKTEGIKVVKSTTGQNKWSDFAGGDAFSASFTTDLNDRTAWNNANITANLVCTITVDDTFAKYVSFKEAAVSGAKRNLDESGNVYTFKAAVLSDTTTIAIDLKEKAAFEYTKLSEGTSESITEGKPQTLEQYKAMDTALTSVGDAVTVKFDVEFLFNEINVNQVK